MLGNIADGLMLTGGGIVIGSWLALWLTPSDHKLNMIRVGICGMISVGAFICWVKLGTYTSLIAISQWPVMGVTIVSIISYSVFVAAIEPIWISLDHRLRPSGQRFKETIEDVADQMDKYERKAERDNIDKYFEEWEARQENRRREPRVGDRNLSEELMDEGRAYIAKEQLMSPSEQFAYKVIEYKYSDRFYVFSQVRVVDVIKPNVALHKRNSREFYSLFRQLSQWHFDFVLCSREDFRIWCAIELDDPSHKQKERQKRDRILNRACEVAGLRLERMTINYDRRIIEKVACQ
ncbi:DUF2726 domain-containing protein [Salinicola lusitanus]|uniref:DUF2726 domain-containing protein n=1 Tax=Salinicola lusitanus TaxID=1949085 RepID=UPI0013005E18|nr:DUF2726 domain-containing protein [Salinicola lusitanus]